jgi:hypothetical protein
MARRTSDAERKISHTATTCTTAPSPSQTRPVTIHGAPSSNAAAHHQRSARWISRRPVAIARIAR